MSIVEHPVSTKYKSIIIASVEKTILKICGILMHFFIGIPIHNTVFSDYGS